MEVGWQEISRQMDVGYNIGLHVLCFNTAFYFVWLYPDMFGYADVWVYGAWMRAYLSITTSNVSPTFNFKNQFENKFDPWSNSLFKSNMSMWNEHSWCDNLNLPPPSVFSTKIKGNCFLFVCVCVCLFVCFYMALIVHRKTHTESCQLANQN